MQNQEIKINQGLVDSLLKSNFERADFMIQHLGESYGADYQEKLVVAVINRIHEVA